jgi:hypothetical protein
MLPAQRSVLGTGGRAQSMTVVFRPALLDGGTRYGLGVSPDLVLHPHKAAISVSQVVYSLDAWST